MLRLFTDFDGPLMDVSERYYHVYKYCLERLKEPEQEVKQLNKEEFWELKRSRVPEKQIGIISGLNVEQARWFAHLRKQTVHTQKYLQYDKLQPRSLETLSKIQYLDIQLLIITMRRDRELEAAFATYKELGKFFPKESCYCLSDDYIKTSDVEDKPLLMAKAFQELTPVENSWMIGDTEADIAAAKTHGVKMIAVLSGIRNRQQLQMYEPEYIVDNFSDALELLTSVENC